MVESKDARKTKSVVKYPFSDPYCPFKVSLNYHLNMGKFRARNEKMRLVEFI